MRKKVLVSSTLIDVNQFFGSTLEREQQNGSYLGESGERRGSLNTRFQPSLLNQKDLIATDQAKFSFRRKSFEKRSGSHASR